MNDHIRIDIDAQGRLEVSAAGVLEIEPDGDRHILIINAVIGEELHTRRFSCADLRLEEEAINPLVEMPELLAPPLRLLTGEGT
jgi:hypothetical protein